MGGAGDSQRIGRELRYFGQLSTVHYRLGAFASTYRACLNRERGESRGKRGLCSGEHEKVN